jgi:hypothetical protein
VGIDGYIFGFQGDGENASGIAECSVIAHWVGLEVGYGVITGEFCGNVCSWSGRVEMGNAAILILLTTIAIPNLITVAMDEG